MKPRMIRKNGNVYWLIGRKDDVWYWTNDFYTVHAGTKKGPTYAMLTSIEVLHPLLDESLLGNIRDESGARALHREALRCLCSPQIVLRYDVFQALHDPLTCVDYFVTKQWLSVVENFIEEGVRQYGEDVYLPRQGLPEIVDARGRAGL